MTSEQARLIEGYEPRFDIDAEVGRQGELLVLDLIAALRSGRVEVKTDERATTTGRVYIEHECRRSSGWRPSGVALTSADLWAVVLGRGVIVAVPTAVIRRVHARGLAAGYLRETTRGSHPTRGVAIPLTLFVSWCLAEQRALAGTDA